MKNTVKKIIATLAALATIPTTTANALCNCDEGETLPIVEGSEIAEFFDDKTPESFSNFYLATDGEMYDLENIVAVGQLWQITDGGFYSESGKVWVLFDDHGTFDFEDDEIIEIFKCPYDDSAELEIYETIYSIMQDL